MAPIAHAGHCDASCLPELEQVAIVFDSKFFNDASAAWHRNKRRRGDHTNLSVRYLRQATATMRRAVL